MGKFTRRRFAFGVCLFVISACFRLLIRSAFTEFSGSDGTLIVSPELFKLNAFSDILNVCMCCGMLIAVLDWMKSGE